VLDVFDFEMIREKLDYLFFGEVVPCRAVPVTKADHKIGAAFFQNSVDAPYEGPPVLNLHVVKAAHVKGKVELFVFKGKV